MIKKSNLFVLLLVCAVSTFGQADKTNPMQYNTFVLDNIPIAKTPKYLGLNVEVMKYADRTNLWDWLEVSNANIVRTPHPARFLRKKNDEVNRRYAQATTKKEFEAFCERIKKDPEKEIIWDYYLFSEELPWLGVMDEIMARLKENGKASIFEMSYDTSSYPEPILLKQPDETDFPDEIIHWPTAASAYEYYFACIYRYSSRKQGNYYMMRNEPPIDDEFAFQQFGMFAKMARSAMEDVRSLLKDQHYAASLELVGPAVYSAYEEYLAYTKNNIDILDVHFYDTGGSQFREKLRRALMRARQNNLKLSLTEFGRIGGGMDIEQSLFSLSASLQLAELMIEMLSVTAPNDPVFEMALLYQFQFPATHRNYKSLVYGDMNMVDWTGQDHAPQSVFSEDPSFEQSQLRFATPAFDIYRMFARCTPGNAGNDKSGNKVYELMYANRGVTAIKDKLTGRNLWPDLDLTKYYANDGFAFNIKSVVVESDDRIYINILNQEPASLKDMRIDISSFPQTYTTAVVRETSLTKRDEPVSQQRIENSIVHLDIPAESFLQIILVKEDLHGVSEIKTEEKTFTPGNLNNLGVHETTILKTQGKIGDRWMDLSDLNIIYDIDKNKGFKIYSSGLLQKTIENGNKSCHVTVKLLDGKQSVRITVQ